MIPGLLMVTGAAPPLTPCPSQGWSLGARLGYLEAGRSGPPSKGAGEKKEQGVAGGREWKGVDSSPHQARAPAPSPACRPEGPPRTLCLVEKMVLKQGLPRSVALMGEQGAQPFAALLHRAPF